MTITTRIAAAAVGLGAAAATLTACGSDSEGGGSSASAASMTVIVGDASDAYYQSLLCGAKTEAKKLDVDITLQGPKSFDTSQQVPIVNAATAKHPDAIIIAPTDSKALYQPLKQAADDGSKIVTVDTTLDDDSFLSSAVSADWASMGTLGAQQIAQAVGEKGTVLAIFNIPGVTTNDIGRKAFLAEMDKHPGVDAVVQYSNGSAGKSTSIVSAALSRYPDLAGIMTFNGGDAEGAVTGLKEAGKTDSVAFVAGGGRDYQVGLLRDGTADALLVPAPSKIGAGAVDQALAAIKGEAVEKEISTGIVVATKDNMDDADVKSSFYTPC